jgi:hypothetical protein
MGHENANTIEDEFRQALTGRAVESVELRGGWEDGSGAKTVEIESLTFTDGTHLSFTPDPGIIYPTAWLRHRSP